MFTALDLLLLLLLLPPTTHCGLERLQRENCQALGNARLEWTCWSVVQRELALSG